MIISGRFPSGSTSLTTSPERSRRARSALLIFFFLAVLIHFYFNRTTINLHYGKAFYRLGRECQDKCGLDEQLSYFQKAVFYDPNLNDAYYQMGIIYGKLGKTEKEFASYQRVTVLDRTNADAYFKVGRYYFEKGELDYALRSFLQSHRYRAGSHDTFYYLAQIYEKKQMYEDATHHYVPVAAGGTPLSPGACLGIWRISQIPGQQEMVLDKVSGIRVGKEREKLWEQIDRYIRTDHVPEFMR